MINRANEIKIIPVSEIKANPKNRNKHPKEQIERLEKIISYQGFRTPVTISNRTGLMVAGHGRLLAAKKLGMTEVPAIYQDFDNEEQEIAHGVSDNAIALWSELDLEGINIDVPELGPDFDIDWLGIKNFKIDVSEHGLCDEDAVPEKVEPRTRLGDIYQLGDHRLMCGDSTSIDAVETLMNGEKADMVFTSPPYNGNTTGIDGKFGNCVNPKLYLNNASDDKTSEDYVAFNGDIFKVIEIVTQDNATIFYNINYNKNSPHEYIRIINESLNLFALQETIVWLKKMAISLAGDNLTRIYEFIFMLRKGAGLPMNKDHHACIKNLWEISNIGANIENHKACFPVALVETAINLVECTVLFEPFGGSGTTLIACQKTNRKCFMMELDPHYCDVIVARWEQFTGQKAVLFTK